MLHTALKDEVVRYLQSAALFSFRDAGSLVSRIAEGDETLTLAILAIRDISPDPWVQLVAMRHFLETHTDPLTRTTARQVSPYDAPRWAVDSLLGPKRRSSARVEIARWYDTVELASGTSARAFTDCSPGDYTRTNMVRQGSFPADYLLTNYRVVVLSDDDNAVEKVFLELRVGAKYFDRVPAIFARESAPQLILISQHQDFSVHVTAGTTGPLLVRILLEGWLCRDGA